MIHKTTAMTLAAAAAFCLGVGSAAASDVVASVAQVNGSALVNQGEQYQPAVVGTSLREGNRLMTMEGGSITVKYQDGCVKDLTENQVMTVGAADSCSAATLSPQGEGSYHAAAPVLSNGAVLAGFAGVGAIAAGALDTGRSRDLPSISP